MNKVVLIGRLTKDPEVKTVKGDTKVANFTLAVDRQFKNANGEKEADFIPVIVWRKAAELVEKYLAKGSQIAVVGRLQTRSYEASDGTKRYVTEVVSDELQFLGSPKAESEKAESKSKPEDNPLEGFEEVDIPLPF